MAFGSGRAVPHSEGLPREASHPPPASVVAKAEDELTGSDLLGDGRAPTSRNPTDMRGFLHSGPVKAPGSWSNSQLGDTVMGLGELLSLWDLGVLVCVMRAGVQEHFSPRLSAWPQQVNRGE